MALSREQIENILGPNEDQESLCIELSTIGLKITNAQKTVDILKKERDAIISRLSETGYPINGIAGIAGLNRHKVSEIISFMSARRKIDSLAGNVTVGDQPTEGD